jgi:hypothetical protein
MAGWLLIVQVALWAGIAHGLADHSLAVRDTYPLILFAIFALYLHAPLMIAVRRKPVMTGHTAPRTVTA